MDNAKLKKFLRSKRFLRSFTAVVIVILAALVLRHLLNAPEKIKTDTPSISIQNPDTNGEDSPLNAENAPSAQDFLNSIPKDKPAPAPTPAPVPITKYTHPASTTPTIDHLSSTAFGNGDSVTIYGTNFTVQNTVLLSIEFPNSYINIPSAGTSITFTANLSVSKSMAAGFSKLTPEQHAFTIARFISLKSQNSPYKDGWYIPATITVVNENGKSNSVPVEVNVLKGI